MDFLVKIVAENPALADHRPYIDSPLH
jgi:hypothetical protein